MSDAPKPGEPPAAGHIYGALEAVAALKCHAVMPGCCDPTGRFVGYRKGRNVVVLDTAPDVPTSGAMFKEATSTRCLNAISPDGARIAVRNVFAQTLEVRGPAKVQIATETRLMTWDGQVLPPRAPAPPWGYGDEHVAFDVTGEFVVLCTHLSDGQACVQAYRSDTLALVDTLTDLRLYSYYATDGQQPYAPMPNWSESFFVQDPLEPGLILGVRNAGDSCLGVFALRVEAGRITQVDPEALSAAVFKVDNYCLRGLRLLPNGGLLVVDRDHHLGRVAWPPASPPTVERHRYALRHLQEDYEVKLPWFLSDDRLEASEALTVTADHLLININADDFTVGMAALDPVSLEPLGLIKRPQDRLQFGELVHLGGDLFAGVAAQTTRLWRLRR